jgi:hypothetical protein
MLKLNTSMAITVLTVTLACLPEHTSAAKKTATKHQNASQLVQEALHKEIEGTIADRESLLSKAVSIAPSHPAARWQTGFVEQHGEWKRFFDREPGQVSKASPANREYLRRSS